MGDCLKCENSVYKNMTISEWLERTIGKYEKLDPYSRIKLLFTSEGMDKLSQMLAGS